MTPRPPSGVPTIRPLTPAPAADVEVADWVNPWTRLIPLWRHGVWLAAVFSLLALSLWVRLDVKQTVHDLHRNAQLTREATLANERLQLEVQSRRGAIRMEAIATELGLASDVPLTPTGGTP